MKTEWKVLQLVNGQINSILGSDCTWKIGRWQPLIKDIELCRSGYHSSSTIQQALWCCDGNVLAKVECKGKAKHGANKSCHQQMKIISAWKLNDKIITNVIRKLMELEIKLDSNNANAALVIKEIDSGALVALLGGSWADGAYAGAAYWSLFYSSGISSRDIGARCTNEDLQKIWLEELQTLEEIK